jgi:hypothetical protein
MFSPSKATHSPRPNRGQSSLVPSETQDQSGQAPEAKESICEASKERVIYIIPQGKGIVMAGYNPAGYLHVEHKRVRFRDIKHLLTPRLLLGTAWALITDKAFRREALKVWRNRATM